MILPPSYKVLSFPAIEFLLVGVCRNIFYKVYFFLIFYYHNHYTYADCLLSACLFLRVCLLIQNVPYYHKNLLFVNDNSGTKTLNFLTDCPTILHFCDEQSIEFLFPAKYPLLGILHIGILLHFLLMLFEVDKHFLFPRIQIVLPIFLVVSF